MRLSRCFSFQNIRNALWCATLAVIALFPLLFSPSLAFGATIQQVEWESSPGAPWDVNGPTIDCSVTPSPSGGCALKFTYNPGNYSTSFSAGRASVPFSELTELYWGHWNRYSSGFVFNGNGTKMDFLVLATKDGCGVMGNMAVGWKGSSSAPNSTPTNQIGDASCGGTGTQDYNGNYTATTNQWVWIEEHFRVNTPGVANGLYEMWINDVLQVSISNVQYRNPGVNSGWNLMYHTAEWGGGGGTIPAAQYWWVDHTVLSTSRIGMPGGAAPPADPTPIASAPAPAPAPAPSGTADVVVTALSYANGAFTATVKNQGTSATPSGTQIGVGFFADSVYKTYGLVSGPLAAGSSIVINSAASSIIPDGAHTIMAYADDVNRFAESNETNNQLSQTVTVGAGTAGTATAPTATTGTQTPYASAIAIPGTVNVAQYDNGGEGVAYHDLDAANQYSGTYRPGQGVDADIPGVAWIQAGEWIEYTVNVSAAGTYNMSIPLAHPGAGGTLHIEFNGVRSPTLTAPDTGSWSTPQNLSQSVTLGAGTQVMRISFDSNGSTGAVANLGNITISGTGTVSASPTAPLPGPANFKVTGSTFTWNAVSGAAGYLLRVHQQGTPYDPCTSMAFCAAVTGTSKTVALKPSTTYDAWIHSHDAGGIAGTPIGITFTTAPAPSTAPLPPPANFKVTGNTFTWNAVSGAAVYLLRVHQQGTPYDPCTSMAFCAAVTGTSKTVTLKPGTVYDAWIHSQDANGAYGASQGIAFTTAQSLPDVVVTGLSYANGTFTATVRNQGSVATPSGVPIGVGYFVDGQYKTYGLTSSALAAGASVTIGTNGNSYAIPSGTHTIMAYADDVNRFPEANETNNQLSQSISIASAATALTPTQQIEKLYQDILGRGSDPSGLAYWVGQLNSGVSLLSIRGSFANSPECRDAINRLYVRAYGRNATSTELANKISFLTNGGTLAQMTVP